jgi:hypothetical protein
MRIAAAAFADLRTVKKAYSGGRILPLVRARINDAAGRLGLPTLPAQE